MKTSRFCKKVGLMFVMPLAGGMLQASAGVPVVVGPDATAPPTTPVMAQPVNPELPTAALPPVSPAAVQPAGNGAPPQPPLQEVPEILTRGPVHEAFAKPVALKPETGMLAPRQPPADIQEMPPANRPEGEGYAWVPGYWNWDSDRKDFIWVSGCWRLAPPYATWVPGFWAQVADGWRWASGYWRTTSAAEPAYVPAPPDTFDQTPPGETSTADAVWIPGCWYWDNGRFVPRSGYWLRQIPGWIWQPSQYRWTPNGYAFVPGYWDYDMERRGVLFAPVALASTACAQPGYVYTPAEVLDPGVVADNLFVYPNACQYYFGDYYDWYYPAYGFFPCFECFSSWAWFDPIFCHRCFLNRGIGRARFLANERARFENCRADPALRPARTFAAQQAHVAGQATGLTRGGRITQPLSSLVAAPKGRTGMSFVPVSPETRQLAARQAHATQLTRAAQASRREPSVTRQVRNTLTTPSFTPSYRPSFTATPAPAFRSAFASSSATTYRPSYSAPHEVHYAAPARAAMSAPAFAGRAAFSAPASRGSAAVHSGGGGGGRGGRYETGSRGR